MSVGITDTSTDMVTVLCRQCRVKTELDRAADVLGSFSNLGGYLAKQWVQLFEKAPRLTASATVVSTFVGIGAAIFAPPPASPKKSGFEEQIAALDQTQASLDQLARFVGEQRELIRADRAALQRLQGEQRRLEPLVNADRRTVKALLMEQNLRAEAALGRERWIGFGFGVLGSLVASALFAGISILLRHISARRKGAG